MLSNHGMADGVLKKKLEDGVLLLTLNRPDKLNALTWELMSRLKETLEEASADPAVRVVILAGEGRAFCAGGNIGARNSSTPTIR